MNSTGNPVHGSRRIIRGTATYTAAAILQRAIPFLLLPFFTRILTPSEFGQIGILTTLAAALSVVVSFGLETAVFRGYLQVGADQLARNAFVNTVGGFAIVAPIALAAGFSAVAAPTLASAFDVPADALRLASAGAALTAGATLVPLALLRAQERLGSYLQLTGVQVIVTPLLTIFFVAILGWGVLGWMLAYSVGAASLLLRGLALLGHQWAFRLDVRYLWAALGFGLPLVPHALSHWGLAVSDRAILGALVPDAQVGAYYVAFLFSLPINLIAIGMSQATQPVFAEAARSRLERSGMSRLVTVHAALVAWTAAGVALLGPPVIRLALPPEYSPAAGLVPWLALGACMFGIYLMPMNAIAITAGRTQKVWMITSIAAATNIGLNLLLVPHLGTLAAAINTTIGYGVLLIGVFLYARKVCDPPIRYERSRTAVAMFLIAASYVTCAQFIAGDSLGGLIARVLVLVGTAGLVIVVGPFTREAKAALTFFRPAGEGTQ